MGYRKPNAHLMASDTPFIYNVTITNADTEYSQALPAGCKRFKLSIQGLAAADTYRVAYVTGKVATPTAPYYEYTGSMEHIENDLNVDALTVYFACDNGAKVAQIIAWT